MKFGVDYAHNTGNQHYWRLKWNSGIKSFVEEEMPCKTRHQWRPRTSTTPANIAVVRDLIEGNRRLTVVEICQELGISYGSVQSIIKTELQFQKVLARWVPRLLSDQQESRNRRKIGPVVLDCPTTPAVQPGPLPFATTTFRPLKEALGRTALQRR